MLFGVDARPRLWKEHPGMKQTEIMSRIGQLWRGMGEQQKNSYTTKADRLKEEYAAKMKVYKLYTANVAAFTAEVAEERAKDAAVAAGQAFACRKIEFEFRLDKTSFLAAQQDSYSCPWCNCGCWGELQALLMHLTLCHPRMIFTYEGLWDRGRIVVSIAESRADSANPSDAVDMVTYTPLPLQKNSCFVMKGKRPQPPALHRFVDNGIHSVHEDQRRVPAKRKYYHTESILPVIGDIVDDADSEDDEDKVAMFAKMELALDDFSDVNAAANELMKMWNKHMLLHPVLMDAHVFNACKTFIQIHAEKLGHLKNNFRLHVSTLFDYGVLTSLQVRDVCVFFDEQVE